MRVVIDLQGAQINEDEYGISAYLLSLTQAIIRMRGPHRIIIALSGLFPESIDSIREQFSELLPREDIVVWHTLANINQATPAADWRLEVAQRIREAFLASLKPDIIYVAGLFEGYYTNVVSSFNDVCINIPTVISLFNTDSMLISHQQKKMDCLKQTSLCHLIPSLYNELSQTVKPFFVGQLPVSSSISDEAYDEEAVRLIRVVEHYVNQLTPLCHSTDPIEALLLKSIKDIKGYAPNDDECIELAECITQSLQTSCAKPRLLIDISVLSKNDVKTGIQRVVRALLLELINNSPMGYEIQPVYLANPTGVWQLKYAKPDMLANNLNYPAGETVEFTNHDVFLGLDFCPQEVIAARALLHHMHRVGMRIVFLVYDLLPLIMPTKFPVQVESVHQQWLSTISQFDGIVCISKSVADDFRQWMLSQSYRPKKQFKIDWFHLGADLLASSPSCGFPEQIDCLLKQLASRPSCLMVGTIEPRKGYQQTLAAFDIIWQRNIQVNLVIVGKPGWMMDVFLKKLHQHPQLNRQLFYIDNASDECLERIYSASSALIAASEAEGFGLPLIEAAKHGLAIIARDIKVFREIAGVHAYYFSTDQADELAYKLMDWLALYAENTHPITRTMPWLTWQRSAEQLKESLFEE